MDSFLALSKSLQSKIDKAFTVVNSDTSAISENGGGFLPENGGGFIPESSGSNMLAIEGRFSIVSEVSPTTDSADSNSFIPLSLVPTALQRLDLPPDDPEVLAIFHNAASGWKFGSKYVGNVQNTGKHDLYVSREDWRSVCAVLLEGEDKGMFMDDNVHGQQNEGSEMESDYDEKINDNGSGDDSDEYVEGRASTRKRTRRPLSATTKTTPSRKRTHTLSEDEDASSDDTNQQRPLTARQRKTCLTTFALFFPEASKQDLPLQRIMIKDIQRVAKVLGEKIKAEEVNTSRNDPSHSF